MTQDRRVAPSRRLGNRTGATPVCLAPAARKLRCLQTLTGLLNLSSQRSRRGARLFATWLNSRRIGSACRQAGTQETYVRNRRDSDPALLQAAGFRPMPDI